MLTTQSRKSQLAQSQALLTQILQTKLPEKIPCTVSGVSGGYQGTVAYSSDLDLWHSYQADEKKHFNGFGLGKPQNGKKVAFANEINFPTDGINRAISGVFAQDENGKIFLLHRGKAVFSQHFTGETVAAQDGDKTDTFALIGKLNADLPAKLAAFVREMVRIKAVIKGA
ncbi:restriction endonuclease [Kingella kingae]|uniref:hypothetical protein n=1 Tax=Kingella kingae TaxID=504 RepID=UPI0004194337|nr:hypothetical protein [Kingella kingae]MDK4576810.1 restriction endonuclease [Kingella kingae]MDK4582865.1 restriction endonuclease [Kingella kingae]MDK4646875.1 restriction endonuclease [Kingella kingae]